MNETILVVEDEPPLRQLIGRALTAAGYRVLEARNGAEALELFERHGAAVDLVVTDLQMPYVDGAALVDELRTRRRTLKTLCISGTRTNAEFADAFIAKPFSRDVLLSRIRVLLDPASEPGVP
jgi:DNA-binding response OmpR family regulator